MILKISSACEQDAAEAAFQRVREPSALRPQLHHAAPEAESGIESKLGQAPMITVSEASCQATGIADPFTA